MILIVVKQQTLNTERSATTKLGIFSETSSISEFWQLYHIIAHMILAATAAIRDNLYLAGM